MVRPTRSFMEGRKPLFRGRFRCSLPAAVRGGGKKNNVQASRPSRLRKSSSFSWRRRCSWRRRSSCPDLFQRRCVLRQAGNLISMVQRQRARILAVGMGIVIIGRGIDLSAVAVMAMSVAWYLQMLNSGVPAGSALGLGAGGRGRDRADQRLPGRLCRRAGDLRDAWPAAISSTASPARSSSGKDATPVPAEQLDLGSICRWSA